MSVNGASSAVMQPKELQIDLSTSRRSLPSAQDTSTETSSKLWSVLKSCVGQDLTRVAMPITWNEPLSLLQRLTEYMTYSQLLTAASLVQQENKRAELVAAFAVSALASNAGRSCKPFNPLLGETYEMGVADNYRMVCEQVSHHPPVSAFHAEEIRELYVFRGSVKPKIKFWGKSLEFKSSGSCEVILNSFGETHAWKNVSCVVNNIIGGGQLSVEHRGVLEINVKPSGRKIFLNFKQAGWSGQKDDLHAVEGFLCDAEGQKERFLYGKWDEFLCSVDITSLEEHLGFKTSSKTENDASNLPKHRLLTMAVVPNSTVLWLAEPRSESSSLYYSFTNFSLAINELKPEAEPWLCPSDSRWRPDMRALECGQMELAAKEKSRLEEKQREARKKFKGKKEEEWWAPKYFDKQVDDNKEENWVFNRKYWTRTFDKDLDIF